MQGAVIFIFFLAFLAFPAGGAENSPENSPENSAENESEDKAAEAESSPYLMNFRLGDSDVDLRLEGYWRMSLVGGGSFGRRGNENRFRGLREGFSFFQEPDLTISLWLNNRWFLEASFLEGFDRNTYRAGYRGEEGEFVQEVVVGSAGVSAAGYGGIAVPDPRRNTPGIAAKFASERSKHEFLLRYDPTETGSAVFQGPYRVRTGEINPANFIEGRYFILPDTGVQSVSVYLEDRGGSIIGTDADGTARRYRAAEAVQYTVDTARGLVQLEAAGDGRVLVYYEAAGAAVGSIGGGREFVVPPGADLNPDLSAWNNDNANLLDFAWDEKDVYDPAKRPYRETSLVNVQGREALILYSPGRFTPFERQNVYSSPLTLPRESRRVSVRLREGGGLYPGVPPPNFAFVPDSASKTIAAYAAVGSPEGLRSPGNRYPFAADDPGIYGTGRITDAAKVSRSMVVTVRQGNSDYSLGSGAVPGSAVVRINGVRDDTVRIVDGRLKFRRLIAADDWIEVSYRTETLDLSGGDVYIYQGNRFDFTPNLRWEIAESFRWNVSRDPAVQRYNESPGEIRAASTLEWSTENAGISLSGSGVLSTPDTAGRLRLFGMEGGGFVLHFFDSGLEAAPGGLPNASGGSSIYTTAGRRKANRYNYVSTDAFGGRVLNDYLWSGAASTGGDGPGLAAERSGDPAGGSVLDLRFELPGDSRGPGGSAPWTAGDVLADSRKPVDLSGYTAIEFPIMFRNDHGGSPWDPSAPSVQPPRLLVQIGEIGEAADHQGDGVINRADGGAMLQWDSSGPGGAGATAGAAEFKKAVEEAWKAPGTWRRVRIPVAVGDRGKLERVRALRFAVINTAGTPISGRLIAGPPRFAGSSFRSEIREAPAGNGRATNQSISAEEIRDNSLKSAYPETAELFHPKGSENRVLRLRWGKDAGAAGVSSTPGTAGAGAAADILPGERWEAVSWFDGVPLDAYRTLVFFVKARQPGTGNLTANITDSKGRGITVSWNSAGPDLWDRITVNIDKKSAAADRGTISFVNVDTEAGDLVRMVLRGGDRNGRVSPGSSRSGTLLFDEVYFKDPAFTFTGTGQLAGRWKYEEDAAAIGSFPILGDIAVEGRIEAAGSTVLSVEDSGAGAVNGDIGVKADVLGVGIRTDWRLARRDSKNLNWSGSHKLRIPARWAVFWLDEAYSRSSSGTRGAFSRENGINLHLAPGSFRAYSSARHDGIAMLQSWGGETRAGGEHWGGALQVRYSVRTLGVPGGEADYLGSWVRDYRYLAPADGRVSSREARHDFQGELKLPPFHLEWTPSLGIKVLRAPNWNQENTWAGTLAFPLRFERWFITPSYSRNLRQKLDTSAGGEKGNSGFDDAWMIFARGMGGQFPLVSYVPFRELFGSADGEEFANLSRGSRELIYRAAFSLSAGRSGGGGPADLFLPSSAALSTERTYTRRGDTTGWKNIWSASYSTRAVNLFGRFGRYPVIGIYNTDEFGGTIRVNLGDYNGTGVPNLKDILWQSDLAFTGNRERRLVLDHRISWNWERRRRITSQEGRIEFHWRTPSKEVLRLPLVRRALPRRHHIENRERIAVRGLYPWPDAPRESVLNMGVIIRHETRWVFQDLGHLKGWLAFGLGGFKDQFTNAWELGLEAELRF